MKQVNIVIIALGSIGDVLPMLAIGEALKNNGEQVTVFGPSIPSHYRDRFNVSYTSIVDEDILKKVHLDSRLWWPLLGPVLSIRLVVSHFPEMIETVRPYCHSKTCLLSNTMVFFSNTLSELTGCKNLTIHMSPYVLERYSKHTPAFFAAVFNYFYTIYVDFCDLLLSQVLKPLQRYRKQFGLPYQKQFLKTYFGSYPQVLCLCPKWFLVDEDVNSSVYFSTFPFIAADEQDVLDKPLVDFLKKNPNPILFTAGSAVGNAKKFYAEAVNSCKKLKKNGILLTAFDENIPKNLPYTIMHVRYAPLHLLMDKASVLVSHGGMGTVSLGMKSNIKQLVMPMSYDQFYNASKVKQLGQGMVLPMWRYKQMYRYLKTLLTHNPTQTQPILEFSEHAILDIAEKIQLIMDAEEN